MKRTIMTLLVAGTVGISMTACDNGSSQLLTPADAAALERVVESAGSVANFMPLLRSLDLTDDQKQAIRDIMTEARGDRGAGNARGPRGRHARGNGSGYDAEAHAARIAEVQAKVLDVLTDEQKATLTAWQDAINNGSLPDDLVQAHLDRLTEALALTADQIAPVREIISQGLQRLINPPDYSDREARQAAAQERKALHEQMLALLTAEQQEKLAEMRAAFGHLGRGGFGKGGDHGARMLEHLTEALGLSETQQTQLAEILENHKPDADIRSLSREERQAKMQEMRTALHEAIKAILTPEQVETFESLIANQQSRRGMRGRGYGPGGR